jgi:tetratricopeptide (TPR) repeat protein
MIKLFIAMNTLISVTLLCLTAHAEVKTIEAESTYIMGDNDSKVDARRIAIQESKRKALELAGTYVESLTQVKNYQLSKDEVKSYTAGITETEVVSEQMRGTTEHPEMYVKTRCKIDTDALMKTIDRYRENEDLKEQVQATSKENEKLRKEREALVKQLAVEKDKKKADVTRQQLDTVLSHEESNDDTKKVWNNYELQLAFGDGKDRGQEIKPAELDKSSVVLQRAVKINPRNLGARMMLASIYERQGNTSAAESELRTAIQGNPSNPLAHMRLGVLLKNRGRYEEALNEFRFVERVRPRNPMMLFFTGMTYKAMGRCGIAVSYLKRFLIDNRPNQHPQKRETAVETIRECGGGRPGRPQRIRYR